MHADDFEHQGRPTPEMLGIRSTGEMYPNEKVEYWFPRRQGEAAHRVRRAYIAAGIVVVTLLVVIPVVVAAISQ